jgi:hypothetical protein
MRPPLAPEEIVVEFEVGTVERSLDLRGGAVLKIQTI